MIRKRYVILMVGALLTLAGCGSSDTPSTPGGAGNSQAASAGASAAEPAADTCGGIGDKVKEHIGPTNVKTVAAIGQCTTVSITSTLADDQSDAAKALCQSAAEVAYSGDTNAIKVLGASGKEMAIGIAKAPCMASF